MAHSHSRGQILIEAVIVILFLSTLFVLIAGHMKEMKKNFEKRDLTQESQHGFKKFHRKK
jgi:competence protein ComGC